ncbi:PAS domain S-box-containing protein [Desulfonatronum zhilinae]|nr:PAS domain S-box-containing protein [Desulfonatronum zhilinae]
MGVNDAVFSAKKELEHTIDSVHDLICVVDRKNVIKRVNMSFARHFNMHPSALIGKKCDELFDFYLPRLSSEQEYPSSAKKNVLQQTIHSERLGGFFQITVSPFNDSSNTTVGAVYVIHNPHQQVGDKARFRTRDTHAREKIAAQDELLRTASIIERVPESVVLTDTNWGISYVNPAFLKMTGLDRRQVLSGKMNLLPFFQHACLPEKDKMEKLMLDKGIWHGSFVVRCKDGSRRDTRAQISPLKGPDGAITNYVAILCDVTHEVRLERRIRNVEKLEAIGIAAGGTAHDFNNILGGIIGSIELAAEQLEDGDPVRTDLELALGYAEDAKKLVSQILTFKRQGSPTVLPSAGLDLVQSAIAVTRGLLPKGVRIVQKLQPTTWQLVAESTHMHQILMNLCTNAAQAMDGQGAIKVTLAEAILEGPLAVYDNQLPEGEYLHLAVRDNGRGIPEEIRDQVFEPLFTTRKSAGGTGMGLPIVHAVSQKLGGGVVLDSRQGRGTTVHVYLPRCIPPTLSPGIS